jgi:hypothetical protein
MTNGNELTVHQEKNRYKKALEDIRDYCPYAAARDMAVVALDHRAEMRMGVPKSHG